MNQNDTPEAMRANGDKLRYELLPPLATTEMAAVMTLGAIKYEPNNWTKGQPIVKGLCGSGLRHLFAYMLGQDRDPETGMHHGAHLMCNGAFMVEQEYRRSYLGGHYVKLDDRGEFINDHGLQALGYITSQFEEARKRIERKTQNS